MNKSGCWISGKGCFACESSVDNPHNAMAEPMNTSKHQRLVLDIISSTNSLECSMCEASLCCFWSLPYPKSHWTWCIFGSSASPSRYLCSPYAKQCYTFYASLPQISVSPLSGSSGLKVTEALMAHTLLLGLKLPDTLVLRKLLCPSARGEPIQTTNRASATLWARF